MSLGTMGSEGLRRKMVADLAADHSAKGLVLRPEVEAALLAVPRELFTPGLPLDEAYNPNTAVLKKMRGAEAISSVSAPYLIAEMIGQAANALGGLRNPSSCLRQCCSKTSYLPVPGLAAPRRVAG
nr:hypothetical protein [Frankia sp. R82]